NGVISGTLTGQSAGNYTVTVTAANSAESASVTFSWAVVDVTPPVPSSPGPQTTPERQQIDLSISVDNPDNDPLTWSASGLPGGLSIDPQTGVISGQPGGQAAAAQPYSVTVTVTDGTYTRSTSFDWTIIDTTPPTASGASS